MKIYLFCSMRLFFLSSLRLRRIQEMWGTRRKQLLLTFTIMFSDLLCSTWFFFLLSFVALLEYWRYFFSCSTWIDLVLTQFECTLKQYLDVKSRGAIDCCTIDFGEGVDGQTMPCYDAHVCRQWYESINLMFENLCKWMWCIDTFYYTFNQHGREVESTNGEYSKLTITMNEKMFFIWKSIWHFAFH